MNTLVPSSTDVFMFGPPGGHLFGALHEAETYAQREFGVVICYPFGGEYLRSHRACRHLAALLARAGFPVLRFDYRGTGDSSGDAEDMTLSDWRTDIDLAIDILRERTGVESICLAGLRLGASLGLDVATNRPDVGAVIAWEPIVNGHTYLAELAVYQRELLWRFFNRADRQAARLQGEILGFPLGSGLRCEIEQLSMRSYQATDVEQALIVESDPSPNVAALRDQLLSSGASTTLLQIPAFPIWRDDVDKGLVPEPTLRAIVNWAEESLP